MRKGYLLLETQPDQPEVVSVRTQETVPRLDWSGLRFVARFDDIDAALMHLHAGLRRHLYSLEPQRYAVSIDEAVAAADAIELDHRRVFIEPELAECGTLHKQIQRLHRQHQRFDWLMHAIGALALVILILWGLIPL